MSSLAVTYPGDTGTKTIQLTTRSRIRIWSDPAYVGPGTSSTSQLPVWGDLVSVAPGVSAGNGDLINKVKNFEGHESGAATVKDYCLAAPGTTDSIAPQVTAMSLAAGTLTVTRTGGSDAITQSQSVIQILRAGNTTQGFGDVLLSMPEISSLTFTP